MNNSGDGIKKINEKKFIDASVLLIDLALSLGDVTEAKEIQKKALAVLDDSRLRDAIPADEIKQETVK
jgi:accessory colonization factor AcfC